MNRLYVDYEECKHIWDKKNKYNNDNAFLTKQQMVSYAANKFGVSAKGHPELKEYATMYMKERKQR